MARVEVPFEVRDGVAVFRPSERLDVEIGTALRDAVQGLLDRERRRWVVIDLAQVGRIDSSGLGALIACLKGARVLGGDVAIAGLQPPVKIVFEITRMHRLFPAFDDVPSAVASFRGRAMNG